MFLLMLLYQLVLTTAPVRAGLVMGDTIRPDGIQCKHEVVGRHMFSCRGHSHQYELLTDEFRTAEFKCLQGDLRCEEMPQFFDTDNRTLHRLSLEYCSIPTTFECLLSRLGAGGVRQLAMSKPRGEFSEAQARGLELVEMLAIVSPDGSSVLYKALPHMPSLKDARVNQGVVTPLRALNSSSVTRLDISSDSIQDVGGGLFAGLPGLKKLLLNSNSIEILNTDTFTGLDLQALHMSSNPLSELQPGALTHMQNLQTLNLRDHRLQRLHTDVFRNLSRLQEVYLNQRFLKSGLPTLTLEADVFSYLPSLTSLNLSHTPLSPLPSHLFRESNNLTSLELSGCGVQKLPVTLFSSSQKLEALDLSRNKIESLPLQLFRPLEALLELDLSHNLIEALEENVLTGLFSLVSLRLDGNRIREVHPHAFFSTDKLRTLTLSNNSLTYCPSAPCKTPFGHLSFLQDLDLSHNHIARVALDWTQSFVHNIRSINLSWNNITELKGLDLQFTGRKLVVDLSHNNISRIEAKVTTDPHQQLTVRLDYNPLVCDCRLYSFLNYTRHHPWPQFSLAEARCARPAALESAALAGLPLDALACAAPACPPACRCLVRPAAGSLELNCTAAPAFDEFPSPLDAGMNHTKLTLRRPFARLALPAHVAYLGAAGLQLTDLPDLPSGLKEVDLRANRLRSIPSPSSAIALYFGGNELDCACGRLAALAELRARLRDATDVRCGDGDPLYGTLDRRRRACERGGADAAGAAGAGAAAAGALLALVALLAYKYSTELSAFLYRRGWDVGTYEREVDGMEYDATVSYADADERLALETLVAGLERRGLRAWARRRDTDAGAYLPRAVAAAVARSRRVLLLRTARYARDEVAALELRAARAAEARGRRRIVVVDVAEGLTDAELAQFFSEAFWEDLCKKMPKRRKEKEPGKNPPRGDLNVQMVNGKKVTLQWEKAR